jgi:general secretion pathway protein C
MRLIVKSSIMNSDQRLSSQNGQANPLLLAKGAAVILLIVWMALSLSGLVGRLIPKPDLADIEIADNAFAPAKSGPSAPPVDIASLKGIKLFGEETKQAVKPEATPAPVQKQVEETKLNLELVGSFASENQNSAYAIISQGKKQELYRVNEEVAGLSNVKLTRVYADRVVLNNRGRQEALFMYPEGQPITSGSNTLVSPELNTSSRTPSKSQGTALAGLNPNQRLEKISDAIRFSRKTKDGKMLGFRVLPGRNRAAFDQTGLKLNDIVTAIDGQVLDNLKAANQIYQQKRNATQASLTVLRGEEELTVDVDLNNINVN